MRFGLILGCLLLAACTPPPNDLQPVAQDVPTASPISSRDGRYRGTGTPDAVQDARGCTMHPYPKALRVTDGHAVMNWADGTAYGDVAADGSVQLKSLNRLVTLNPTAGGYSGRVLAGGGPWCKSTLVLERTGRGGTADEP